MGVQEYNLFRAESAQFVPCLIGFTTEVCGAARAEAEAERADRLAGRLRELGLNPDE